MAKKEFSWADVQKKYKEGKTVESKLYVNPESVKRAVKITAVDDEAIYFKWGIIRNGVLHKENMEKMAALVSDGTAEKEMSRGADYIDVYRELVADEQPMVACILLADLGYIKP